MPGPTRWRAAALRLAPAWLLLLLAGCFPRLRAAPLPGSLPSPAEAACPPTAAGPSHFALRSSFWLNLHNFLFLESKRARGIRNDSPSAMEDPEAAPAPARALNPAEREVWSRAVAYYSAMAVRGHDTDSIVIRVNDRLAASDSVPEVGAGVYDGRLAEVLRAAAPVYRAVWWPAHDARNRAWIEEMQRLLARYEGCLAAPLAERLGGRWPDRPIRVDATVYASWSGAYTTMVGAPHITISTTAAASQHSAGLESLLHEGGHTMMDRLQTEVREETRRQASASDPGELSHLLLFYTAGDLVARAIPSHRPNAERFGIWRRSSRARTLHRAVEREWGKWLAGERPMTVAVRALVRAARTQT